MDQVPSAAIATMVAAFVAGTISLLGLIISKEQKTSEFRQTWVDALRSDLANYLTQINAINDAIQVSHDDFVSKVEALSPFYIKLNAATFSILLRINPDEKRHQRLVAAMNAFNLLIATEEKLVAVNVRPVEREFLDASQALLKAEWRRVKSGEPVFRIAKILALLVVLTIATFGSVLAYRSWVPNRHDPAQPTSPRAPPPLTQQAK